MLIRTRRFQGCISEIEFMGFSGSLGILVIEVQSAVENQSAKQQTYMNGGGVQNKITQKIESAQPLWGVAPQGLRAQCPKSGFRSFTGGRKSRIRVPSPHQERGTSNSRHPAGQGPSVVKKIHVVQGGADQVGGHRG